MVPWLTTSGAGSWTKGSKTWARTVHKGSGSVEIECEAPQTLIELSCKLFLFFYRLFSIWSTRNNFICLRTSLGSLLYTLSGPRGREKERQGRRVRNKGSK